VVVCGSGQPEWDGREGQVKAEAWTALAGGAGDSGRRWRVQLLGRDAPVTVLPENLFLLAAEEQAAQSDAGPTKARDPDKSLPRMGLGSLLGSVTPAKARDETYSVLVQQALLDSFEAARAKPREAWAPLRTKPHSQMARVTMGDSRKIKAAASSLHRALTEVLGTEEVDAGAWANDGTRMHGNMCLVLAWARAILGPSAAQPDVNELALHLRQIMDDSVKAQRERLRPGELVEGMQLFADFLHDTISKQAQGNAAAVVDFDSAQVDVYIASECTDAAHVAVLGRKGPHFTAWVAKEPLRLAQTLEALRGALDEHGIGMAIVGPQDYVDRFAEPRRAASEAGAEVEAQAAEFRIHTPPGSAVHVPELEPTPRLYEYLCAGKCGNLVEMYGDKFVRAGQRAFCAECNEKVQRTRVRNACATEVCEGVVTYSQFELALEGKDAPLLCLKCCPTVDAASWVFLP